MEKPTDDEVKTTLRMPHEVSERIEKEAEKNKRSKNSEIIVLLEEALDAREDKQKRRSK
jgi:hypothetical protein